MNEEQQAIKQLLSTIDKLKTAKTDQQYEPILKALQQIEEMIENIKTAEGKQQLPDLLNTCVNFIVNHKAYPEQTLFAIECFIKVVLKYIITNMFDEKSSQMFRTIMDPSRKIYEYNGHRTEWHDQFITYSYSLNPHYKQFIDNLQIGTYVDCIRQCKLTNRQNWSRGIVEELNQETIKVKYLNEDQISYTYNIRNGMIMPYRSRSMKLDEMLNLNVGQVIIATQSDKWVYSTIKERKQDEQVLKYLIAFRIYTENGDTIEDGTQKKYIGYNQYNDEYITAFHPRLALCGDQQVKPFNSTETYVDDSYDILYEEDYKECKFYGILRPKLQKSQLLIQFINYFGQQGGYDKILQIQSIDILANYMSGLSNISDQLYKKFCQEYIPLLQGMRYMLLNHNEQTLRNLGREKMNLIIQAYNELLDRILSDEDSKDWLSKFGLEIVQICLNCNFLDKKIMGLKLLTDILKQKQNTQILNYIEKQEILEYLFNHNTHLQLLERTKDLCRQYLILDNKQTQKLMTLVWGLMQQNDNELRPIIYKIVNELADSMTPNYVNFFVEQINLLTEDQILIEHVQLLFELSKYSSQQQQQNAISTLWKIVVYSGNVGKQQIEERARQHLCELLKLIESKEFKYELVEIVIQNIQLQRVESSSLKTLQHLISSFVKLELPQYGPQPLQMTYPFNQQNQIVQKIKNEIKGIEEEQQVSTFEWNKYNIHKILRQSIENLRLINQNINKDLLQETARYMSKLQERILILKQLIKINGTAAQIIDQNFLNLIWNGLIQKSLCKQECDMASAWLRELIEKDQKFCENELESFFQSILNSDSHLTENAFNCFQSILYYVNQKEYRIHREQLKLISNCDAHGNVLSMTNTESEYSYELHLLVDVNQILGIDYLWHIVFNSNLDQAIQLLVKLNLQQQDQFISKILDKMNDQQNILKCLDILRILLNETEIKGIGSLLSLDGLIKGDQFNITIVNDLESNNNRVTIKVYSRMTVFELRKVIAQQIQTSWEQIKLVRNNQVVPDTDNGKTLKQINIRKSELINVQRQKTKPIQQVPLVENNQLTPQFLQVLEDLFKLYSTDGRMSKEQLSAFGAKAANDESFKNGQRIKEVFQLYSNNDYLELQGFIEFYKDCCIEQKIIQVVWKNLYVFGYKNDLTLINNDNIQIDEENLPRYKLSHNERFYNMMFQFLIGQDQIAEECWKLLCSLPVFEAAKNRILQFQDFSQDRSYQLLYSIKIIEYLLYNENYCKQFTNNGGFIQLQKILQNNQTDNNKIVKLVQQFILTIFVKHIAAQQYKNYPNIFQIQNHVKQPLQVNFEIIQQIIDGLYPQNGDPKPIQRVKETEEFMELVKYMNDTDSNINYSQLFDYLLNIQLNIVEADDRIMVEIILQLITTILYLGYCQDEFYKIKQRYQQLLFVPKQPLIRKFAANSLFLIFKFHTELGNQIIKMLIELFPSNDNKDSQSYFDLLAKLIVDSKYQDNNFANFIIEQIKQYESTEIRIVLFQDKTLSGLLSILESLCIIDYTILTEELIIYFYTVHLFCFHLHQFELTPQKQFTPNYVKSKSSESRKIVYRIIILYLRHTYNIELLDLNTIIYRITLYNGFENKFQSKSLRGYVGIRNLGCICYMNAMMQQFYMTPEFRYCMLRADDGEKDNFVLYKDNQGYQYRIDDNLIHQFQRLLANLELSERPDYNPIQFCFSFKDYDNQPVNVSQQQDAQEFLNQFFDRLDNRLKDKGWQQFVESIYGGHTCSQMICNGCKNMREKFDLFYTLSIQVKGVKSLNESFESMINGEVIKDYYCEQCKTKNDLIKRQCLDTLPNVLIVHIQRIVFNLDIFMNEKLSTRLEFPHQLNLQQYTREGLLGQDIKQQSYYQYKLKGVVVHKGTAQYGHYYSLINTKDEKWLKFNDQQIEDFDIKRLSYECFGGKDGDDGQQQDFQEQGSSTNAYILVYERIQKENVTLKFIDEQQKQDIISKFSINEIQQNQLDYKVMTEQFIPQQLFQEIWYDNHQFMMERQIYSDEFFRFLKDIGESYPFPNDYIPITNPEQIPQYFGIYNNYQNIQNSDRIYNLLHMLTYTVFEIISRSADNSSIKSYVCIIMNLINLIPTKLLPIFQSLFIDKQQRLFNVLLCAPDYNVRLSIQQIMLHYINVIIYIHAFTLDMEQLTILQPDNTIIQWEQNIQRFLLDLLSKLQTDVAKNPTKFTQYFNFWRDFVKSSTVNVQFASQLQLVSIFIDFFLEKQSPQGLQKNQYYEFLYDKKTNITSKMVIPFYSPLFQCILLLLQHQQYQLSYNDNLCLNQQILYKRALTECQDFETIKFIILRMIYDNEHLSRNIIDVLLFEIEKSNYETVGLLLTLVYQILNVFDQYQQLRIEWLLGYPEPNYQDNYQTGCSSNLSSNSITYLSHTASQNESYSILNLLFDNHKRFQNSAIQIMKMLLATCNQNKHVFSYLVNLPPPCYLYSKYTDWFEGFLLEFQDDCIKYPLVSNAIFFNKQKELEETLKLWQQFKLNYTQLSDGGLFDSIQPIYIHGNTLSCDLVSKIQQIEGVYLETYEHTIYFLESKPTITTNAVFPQNILYDKVYLQTTKINKQSDIFQIIQNIPTLNIPKPPPLPKKIDEVDGISFNPSTNQEEQQKVNDDFANELVSYQMELEQFDDKKSIPLQSQQQQQQQQQQQDTTLPIINVNPQIAQMYKRIMLNNTTNQTIHIIYTIALDPEIMANFKSPTKVYKIILPNQSVHLTTLIKTLPQLDWGLYIENIEINFSNAIQQTIKKQVRIDEEVQVFMPNLKPKNDEQISCPACTYLQSSDHVFCELCAHEFK